MPHRHIQNLRQHSENSGLAADEQVLRSHFRYLSDCFGVLQPLTLTLVLGGFLTMGLYLTAPFY